VIVVRKKNNSVCLEIAISTRVMMNESWKYSMIFVAADEFMLLNTLASTPNVSIAETTKSVLQ
jgi:hypothetical protein